MRQFQKLITIALIGILFSCTSVNEKSCILTGEVLDRENGNLFLYRPGSSQYDKDTIPFNDGKFEYHIKKQSPEVFLLFFEEDENDDGDFTSVDFFFGEEDVHIKLSMNDIKNPQIKGGQQNATFINVMSNFRAIEDNLMRNYANLKTMSDSIKIEATKDSVAILTSKMEDFIPNYIKQNKNLISAYFVWLMRSSMDKATLEEKIAPLTPLFPKSKYIKETTTYINGFGQNEIGQQFTDYELTTINDNSTALSSIVKDNELTHILFWSSRCSSTDGKLRAYKSIYNEYKSQGYEIVAISDDCDKIRWKNAIKRNEADWTNLLDFDKEKGISEFYHIGLSGDVLINKNGEIISRNFRTGQLKDILVENLK
ncbi:DUF4369 domain-containing protein [Maribellus luteus]|uniref:DUF4369 domain-containing protein n=1 Tax=Maribellus luteus TaxID=2305463 RepID=A0A399SS22_9BACT|nr:DUF4369 domain-containing protein [Maribellus luteus]RIJ45271.1 DUF4369 domain-containing protein [Maribellus luteus]